MEDEEETYHLIDLRCPENDYEGGWIDADAKMFYACFKILREFVEEELPHAYTDWEHEEETRRVRKEIQDLYDWWTAGRKAAHDALDRLCEAIPGHPLEFVPVPGKTFFTLSTEKSDPRWQAVLDETLRLEEEDSAMLERLLRLRGYLWT